MYDLHQAMYDLHTNAHYNNNNHNEDDDPLVSTSDHSHHHNKETVVVPTLQWYRHIHQPTKEALQRQRQEQHPLLNPTISQVVKILGRVSCGNETLKTHSPKAKQQQRISSDNVDEKKKTRKSVRFGRNQVHKITPVTNMEHEQDLWWAGEDVKRIHYQCLVMMHECLQDEAYVWALDLLHREADQDQEEATCRIEDDQEEVKEEERKEQDNEDAFAPHESFSSACSEDSAPQDADVARRVLSVRSLARGLEVRSFKKTREFAAIRRDEELWQLYRTQEAPRFAGAMAELDAQEAAVAYAY